MSIKKKIIFTNKLPNISNTESCVLIYDKVLQKKYSSWIKKFPNSMPVVAGEKLKTLESFNTLIQKIHHSSKGKSTQELKLIALGGGSVGDFVGFCASVYRRGVGFINIPSTWLSAIDSAHGGKTALNLKDSKNQLGSFYPAEQIVICKEVIFSQKEVSFSEAIKVAILDSQKLWLSQRKVKDARSLYKQLPKLISAKIKIVNKDPLEKSGYRHLLNLGHTLGHVFEKQLGISHSESVALGLRFSLEWSFEKKILNSVSEFDQICGIANRFELVNALNKLMSAKQTIENTLMRDKKLTKNKKLRFIFIKKPGKPLIEEVSIKEIATEIKRQILEFA